MSLIPIDERQNTNSTFKVRKSSNDSVGTSVQSMHRSVTVEKLGFKIKEDILIPENSKMINLNSSMTKSMHKRWKAANKIYNGPPTYK